MGCDFYIIKLLRVYYNDAEYLELELNREKGYYEDLEFDEDADDYDEKITEYMQQVLTVKVEPIIIYTNSKFNKSSCSEKYKTIVESELNRYNKKWSDVIQIIKVEERRER